MITIITSSHQLKVGQVYDGSYCAFENVNELYTNYRMLVLREATQGEYEAFLQENFSEIPLNDFRMDGYFYAISMD